MIILFKWTVPYDGFSSDFLWLSILKGKRVSRLRPDFLIYDPNPPTSPGPDRRPRVKKKTLRRRGRNQEDEDSRDETEEEEEDSVASLPETDGLALVLSNIWGTKFRVAGLCSAVPEDLGHVLYRTSLLHLQPRQMTIVIPELGTCGGGTATGGDPFYHERSSMASSTFG